MQTRSEAIILRSVKYGDSSIVLNVFCPEKGVLALISSLSRSSKKGLRLPLMQPLNLVEIIYNDQSKGELKRLQELRILQAYQEIPFDPIRSCIAMFMAELLSKSLKEEAAAPQLFSYIKEACIFLDRSEQSVANFLPAFLMDLSAHLGFEPHFKKNSTAPYFDLLDGHEIETEPLHSYFIYRSEADFWALLQEKGIYGAAEIELRNFNLRRQVLENMLSYYRLHFTDFGTLKSLAVLYEILH